MKKNSSQFRELKCRDATLSNNIFTCSARRVIFFIKYGNLLRQSIAFILSTRLAAVVVNWNAGNLWRSMNSRAMFANVGLNEHDAIK